MQLSRLLLSASLLVMVMPGMAIAEDKTVSHSLPATEQAAAPSASTTGGGAPREPSTATSDAQTGTTAPSPSEPATDTADAPADATSAQPPNVTTGSVDPAVTPPASPLAFVGRSIREALAPPPPPPEGEAEAEPEERDYNKVPTPEEAVELSDGRDRDAVREFYAARNDEPVWVSKTGLEPRALSVIAEIGRSAEWGLNPKDFEVPEIAAAGPGKPELPDADLTKAEMTMALTVLKFMRYARGGAIAKPDRQLSSFYDRRPQVEDRKTVLEEFARTGDAGAYLVSFQPKHEQFDKLRQAWLEARRAKEGKMTKIPSGPDIKPGERNGQVALLRKRMNVGLGEGQDEEHYDEALAAAVRGFQRLRGITPAEGTLDAATRAALAKPIKGNIDQLMANMQAWRYLPPDMGKTYVWLNIPEYMIRIVKNGEVIWTERVTTGLVNKQTPTFSDKIELVTFKSKWRVPDSIKVREVWPSLLRGGGMMRQHGLIMEDRDGNRVDWTKIDWSKANMEDYTLWQPPGRINQLGIVKFSFPSKHYVFMHDTPDKHMFNWSRRAVSHGCMRIRNPLDMATILLGEDKGWDRAKIDDLVKNGPEHNEIELDTAIPVHITYVTARIEEDGKITTWRDIYGHEKRVTLALQGKWSKIDVPPSHLAPLDQSKVPVVASKAPSAKTRKGHNSVQSIISSALGGI